MSSASRHGERILQVQSRSIRMSYIYYQAFTWFAGKPWTFLKAHRKIDVISHLEFCRVGSGQPWKSLWHFPVHSRDGSPALPKVWCALYDMSSEWSRKINDSYPKLERPRAENEKSWSMTFWFDRILFKIDKVVQVRVTRCDQFEFCSSLPVAYSIPICIEII